MSATSFIPIPGTSEGVRRLMSMAGIPLVIVSRHGLGDNVFFSSCFERLVRIFPSIYFCSSVNAYATIFESSHLVTPLYFGGVNGANLGLTDSVSFANHLALMQVDLGAPEAAVYHFGLFEPSLPYSDQRAFVKGRRNHIELFQDGPDATIVPQYHVSIHSYVQQYVDFKLDGWLDGRDLIVIARYGHTDPDKNLTHNPMELISICDAIDAEYPKRFKFLSLDYMPGDQAIDGRRNNLRSVYGFMACDASTLLCVLRRSRLLITNPTGPMLVGSTVSSLRMLTVWKTMNPFHFLDPQFGALNPVVSLCQSPLSHITEFCSKWPVHSRQALLDRWQFHETLVTMDSISRAAISLLRDRC